ncbi:MULTISPECIES: hypothetical protein [unclassified Streptomyces]|uniref:hypothetical protein n=1 Tax=unclassified Streptomyces TaxID=2593676 RepID=UPI00166104BA|nr:MULTISPECIES: hypothetical protein [unclassified Streptomyces]MBD0710258.1 hypothetical protein [Streptomyces sp. CBMA291]MBD0712875.1 hypothetical protein [Streptomyces sp. CBMA370]
MEKLTAAQLKEVFGLSEEAWSGLADEVIEPLDDEAFADGPKRWSGYAFARWLASAHPGLAGAGPRLLRPAPVAESRYLGGEYREADDGTDVRAEYFAGRWDTREGVIAIVFPCDGMPDARRLLDVLTDTAGLVVVEHFYAYDGPQLQAVDRERPELVYHPRWSDLAAHVGGPVPWWPIALRRRAHLTAWTPGDAPAPVDVATYPSWEPLYELARQEPEGSLVRRACFTIGHRIRTDAAENASREMENLRSWSAGPGDSMVHPAVPQPSDLAPGEFATDDAVGAGLAELCGRTDDLAVECLEHVSAWSSEYFPYGGTFQVIRTDVTRVAAEWINRLRDVPPTALHRVWDDSYETVGTFVDPATGSPVVAVKGKFLSRRASEITYMGRAPRRLPEGAVLKEIILDEPIWVRTGDGVLYPAPVMDAPGLSWGYGGSGPSTLAQCVGRLLDDGGAHAVTYGDDEKDEPGLVEYFRIKHKRGTRLTRSDLVRARGGG